MERVMAFSETVFSKIRLRSREIRTELFRKSIHLMAGVVPLAASINISFTMAMLMSAVIIYTWAEWQRLKGNTVPLITEITCLASRERDRNKIVLGPITLALGTLLCLLLYPSPAAAVGIYALAFGDGLSSVVGKIFGRIRIPFTGGKTLEGSLTAFTVIFMGAYAQTGDLRGSLALSAVGTVLEALPLEDMDNLVLPLGVGLGFMLILA